MPRWLFPVFLTVSLSAFAQYGGGGVVLPGGIRLPGGGGQYPGNGQTCPGGQYPVNGQCPGGQYPNGRGMPGMGQVLYGNLRQISYGSLAMETDDGRVIQMQIASNARFYSQFGNARMTDFDPGDYINVQASQDMNGYYLANTITETRKGTPQERTAAQQPLNVSMHGNNQGQNSSQGSSQSSSQDDSSDSNRPVLHRASDSGSGSGSASSSDSSSSSSSDDGRPHMRRADTASTDDSATTSQRPRMASSGDSSVPAQIAPMSDDPGPPVLRRGAGGRDQNVAVAPQDSSADSTPQRPTVRAQDVNGVTQLPTEPPPPPTEAMRNTEGLPQPSGAYSSDDPIIDQTREKAFEFTETLPDYIVKQYTTRYQSESASRGHTSWQALDIVTADVVAENGKESYKNVMVNGKPTKDVEQSGSWSEGEFASTLQAILSPASDALFTNKRSTTIVNRPAYRYDYVIEQPRSSWLVEAGGMRYRPSYNGAIWIDKETSRVLRIEMAGRNLPRDFALDQVESTIDYDFVLIGDKKFLLPTHSEALSCMRGTSECTRNVIEFRNYKKFGADENITFDSVK